MKSDRMGPRESTTPAVAKYGLDRSDARIPATRAADSEAEHRTSLSGCEMSIRDHYVAALHAIARQHGEAAPAVYIGVHDSLQTTVGYTRRHVVEHDTPHYRYDYYRRAPLLGISTSSLRSFGSPHCSSGHRLRTGSVFLGDA